MPRELRIKLFNEVVSLRVNGLSYGQILREIRRRHGIRLYKSQVSEWTRRVHNPYNGRYIPSLELLRPSVELAYIIGVICGDGYATKKSRVIKGYNNVVIGLEAKDREFVEEFGRCLSAVLSRRPIRPRYRKSIRRYVVEVGSRTLYDLLRKPVRLDALRGYTEHCKRCMAAFLRGFADSEGSVDQNGYIAIFNSDLRLLGYVKDLLERLGIEASGPRLNAPRGRPSRNLRNGKEYKTNKDVYNIRIRASSNRTFCETVGFTIRRKKERLKKYLKRRTLGQTPPPFFSHPTQPQHQKPNRNTTYLCPGWDSNPRLPGLQPGALPAELPGRV